MAHSTLYMLMFSINLIFIVTSIYSWSLKRFYVPDAYKDNFGELYPMSRTMGYVYILQLFELPYLILIGRPEALFYVNGTGLLFFTSSLIILFRGYFFLRFYTIRQVIVFMHPVIIVWLILLLPVLGVIELTPTFHTAMTALILFISLGYMLALDQIRRKIAMTLREVDEDEYSNEGDFPIQFARNIQWLPLVISLVAAVTFIADNAVVKMVRDVIFTVLNMWFAIYTLNPHRKTKHLPEMFRKKGEDELLGSTVKYRLSAKYCQETEAKLVEVINEKKLYLEEHLTMNDLTDIMHTNKNYLSEVIARSHYQSFYKLINSLRIEHACSILENDSSAKLEQVAIESGFTSGSAFSQVFKRLMEMSPKEYIVQIHGK